MAPTLLTSVLIAVGEIILRILQVAVLYKHGRRLVGYCTAKSRLERVQVTESQFADDLAVYAASWTAFESVGQSFVVGASYFGSTVSLSKTKDMAMGAGIGGGDDVAPLCVEGSKIEIVSEFTYLGLSSMFV